MTYLKTFNFVLRLYVLKVKTNYFLGIIIITVKNNDNVSTFQTATIH